jgi:Zn-dependent protease with chaperone function
MDKIKSKSIKGKLVSGLALVLFLAPNPIRAQGTRIDMPKNRYTVEQDVELGRQAANEIARQMPLLPENTLADRYVESVGRNLVAAVPAQFRQPAFKYQFRVVNARDINAFALPGGPMFVNRGMIEAAKTEGEMAGVMAHELSHVVLRHGTAQATRQQSAKYQLPALGGAILGAIIGGNLGGIVAQGTQMGIGAYLLKYSREFESQADILGAQIMARAGYDPRDLANMFQTIERESGGSGAPEWLSSHPDPGNRSEAIIKEADRLKINTSAGGGGPDDVTFERVKSELTRMPQALTMAEIEQKSARSSNTAGSQYPAESRIEGRVDLPSSSYRAYTGSNLFQLNVPSNWEQFEGQDSVTFAPRGAYGNYRGQPVFTHGAVAGVVNTRTNNLEQASDMFIGSLIKNNGYLQPQDRYLRASISRRRALQISLMGNSPVTGRTEIVNVYTSVLRNGWLFYVINVAPKDEYGQYQRAFNEIIRSIRLN